MERIPTHYLELLNDSLLKVYWYKKSLRNALRRSGVSENFLSTWAEDESKREMLERLFPKLESSDKGILVMNRLTDTLLEQKTFPDLERLEDSRLRIKQAKDAIEALRDYRRRQAETTQSERDRVQTQQRAREAQQEVLKRRHQLETLADRLNSLSTELGKQDAGYAFEGWFYDLLDYFEVVNRKPYKVQGRQIDGSVTVDGTTYLIELKFTTNQSDAPDIDIFRSKVLSKADNTMGIMVSISGYSGVAVSEASRDKTPLLLLDHRHLYLLLTGSISFSELIARVRRHSSQTGEAYLGIENFGG
jgi:hypothetical protein